MQRNRKNQDFSLWKLKYFVMLERRHLGNIGLGLERPRCHDRKSALQTERRERLQGKKGPMKRRYYDALWEV